MFLILIDDNLVIKQLTFSFIEKPIYLNNFSHLFTILCILLFVNAINMFDGINLQLICFTLFIFVIFILKSFLPIFFILLSINLIFLGLLNYQNKVFIGDGGCYLISSIIGLTFIYQYKNFDNYFFGDEVFVILIIPSIDMLRLFILRIINKKHPFKGDLNHLHHMVNKFTENKNLTVLITIILSLIPTMILLLNFKTYIILVISLTIYSILILYLRQKI